MNGNLRPDLVDEFALPLLGKDHRVGIADRHRIYDRAPALPEIESLIRVQGTRIKSDGIGSMAGSAHLRRDIIEASLRRTQDM